MRASSRHRPSRTVLALGATVLLLVVVACGALNSGAIARPHGRHVTRSDGRGARDRGCAQWYDRRRSGNPRRGARKRTEHIAGGAPTRGSAFGRTRGNPSGDVEGTVEIEGGRCCVGSTAGDTIEVEVAFSATSSAGEVTEMRVATAGIKFDAAAMADVPWEPFAPSKSYPVAVALNWTGYWVSAQFRDAAGNVSPVVYDDISVEGSPAGP